ncbi:MAG: hypothetical protein OEZ41_09760 [Nitrospirota bacterium]|nr:hypothetical protein [Nitrospirota bacterium]MDH5700232.1 hypothetical protein [Nitrospirota bacterium]
MNHWAVFLESAVPSHSHRTTSMRQRLVQGLSTVYRFGPAARASSWAKRLGVPILGIGLFVAMAPLAMGSHRGSEDHHVGSHTATEETVGHSIPGAPFQVFLHGGKGAVEDGSRSQAQANAALKTVVEAFNHMMDHRTDYPRFDEALTKGALQKVIIEPKVVNREGKEFLLLVARTSQKSQVNLLISASALEEHGYLNHPDQLVPVLAREFQWVVSKSDTTLERQTNVLPSDLKQAPIKTNQEIAELSGEEREHLLQNLFRTYLTTTDRHNSLEGQSYYETGTTSLISPAQPDSTTKLYDIRVRAALQAIVREPYFQEHTPKAVRSLLNGKIWNVTFANIPDRDWATRTRVVSKEQSITAGQHEKTIQPAMILINIYRTASLEDPFYAETNGLPMGALPVDKLARVIAREIQDNITEKSMRGHVAQDEISAPQ